MNIFTAFKYYLTSIPTLIFQTNFYVFPLIFFQPLVLIKAKGYGQFYVDDLLGIWTIKEVILDNQYQKHFQIKTGDVVVDIGASIGDFAIIAGKKAKKVYAFEASKTRVDIILKNMTLNNCSNVEVINKKVTSLDQLFKEYKINKCDFLKIDCEGSEYPILKGAKLLSKVEKIVMEAHLFNPTMVEEYRKLKQYLTQNGFKLIEQDNPVHEYLKYLWAYKKFKSPTN